MLLVQETQYKAEQQYWGRHFFLSPGCQHSEALPFFSLLSSSPFILDLEKKMPVAILLPGLEIDFSFSLVYRCFRQKTGLNLTRNAWLLKVHQYMYNSLHLNLLNAFKFLDPAKSTLSPVAAAPVSVLKKTVCGYGPEGCGSNARL